MPNASARDSAGLPPALVKATPRPVRASAKGSMMMLISAAIVVAGIWGSLELARRFETAERHVNLFATERVLAAGDIIQLRKRGGDSGYRITAHYRYTAHGQEFTGATRLRREENGTYAVGAPVGVWYLRSEPAASWVDGYEPHREANWPSTVVPLVCGAVALTLILSVRRQWNLLTNGRPAMATVTKVDKKRTDHGTVWAVHYEFVTMSGATRKGKYEQGRKETPAIGSTIPIVYDRDNTFRHGKYPMPLVRLRENGK